MLNKKAEADPWKLIIGFIIIIICTILILFFFTDTFKSTSRNLEFDCWKLTVPGICLCDDERDCQTSEGRDACKEDLRNKCYG